jgi:hypothetical protein
MQQEKKLLQGLKNEDVIFNKDFASIRLTMFPALPRHFILYSIKQFKFLLQVNKQLTITAIE